MRLWLGVLAIVGIGGVAFLAWPKGNAKDTPAYRTEAIGSGTVLRAVSATGGLEPLVTVDIGSAVSGPVSEVLVDFNAAVSEGEVLARLDPQTFSARVNQIKADVAAQNASLEVARAQVLQAEAELQNARSEFDRANALLRQDFVSNQLVEQKQTALTRAEAALTVAQAQAKAAGARVQQSRANLESAQVDLERSVIRSPVKGVVVDRRVEPGQTVAASFNAPVLFQIAEDLSRLQAKISVDEADIGEIRDGLPVTFTVDAFPGRDFSGNVTQIRKRGVENQGVVSYTVIVEANNVGGELLPGMTANAEIIIENRIDVLRVPNAALRFRPGDPAVAALASAASAQAPGPNASSASGGRPGASVSGGGPPTGGRGGGRMIEALATELELDETQRTALAAAFERARAAAGPMPDPRSDPAAAEAIRPYFRKIRDAALRDLEPLLRDDQKQKAAALRTARDGQAIGRSGTVWVMRDGASSPVPVSVRLGVADDAFTEVVGGDLKPGDLVVTGGGPAAPSGQSTSLGPPGGGIRIRGA